MPRDALGLPLRGASEATAAHYARGVDLHLHAWPGAEAALQAAATESPGFALAHAGLALLCLARGAGAAARTALDEARAALAGADERAASHVHLLAHIVEGRPAEALAAVLAHARAWPLDAFAATTALGAFGLFAFSGRADHDLARLRYVETLAPHYPADHAWLLTQRAWAHVEAGELAAGRAFLERSLEVRRANGNAAHVAMHLHFEAAAPAAALAFVDDWIAIYPDDAMLWGHLHWHAALAHLALGDTDAALQRLHGPITTHLAVAWPLVGLTDIASLLWRLALHGQQDLPWRTGEDFAARWFGSGGNALASLHLAMLAVERADAVALERIASRLQEAAAGGHGGAGAVLHWTRALQARLAGRDDDARRELAACQAQAVCIGGSHAQRTVVEQTRQAWSPARP